MFTRLLEVITLLDEVSTLRADSVPRERCLEVCVVNLDDAVVLGLEVITRPSEVTKVLLGGLTLLRDLVLELPDPLLVSLEVGLELCAQSSRPSPP